jgi:uncharacterized membrane protein
VSRSVARLRRTLPLPPAGALDLWTDLERWPSFVEGLQSIERADPEWPAEGAVAEWRSGAAGRGRVTERVRSVERAEKRSTLATEVEEEALAGVQTVTFSEAEGGCTAQIELEYDLRRVGIGTRLADVLFIRRALSSALARTLERFAGETSDSAV